jgi:cytochrome c oxidase subunit 1/cytochrome c oxidase subunit I+III
VAHFHYVIFGGSAFAILAATHYWFPKLTGRLLSERLGKLHFWLMVVGFNLTFFVQHFLGFMGMPRRVFTYPDLPGWGALNLVSTVGAFLMAIAVAVLLVNIVVSLRRGAAAGDNPWQAWTLEWATTSPPEAHNFHEVPPVRGRRPLYDQEHAAATAEDRSEPTLDKNTVCVWSFVASEASFFAILIFAYIFYNATLSGDGPTAASVLDVGKAGIYTGCLLASSFTLWLAERAQRRADHTASARWLGLTILLGVVFMVGQAREYIGLWQSGVTMSRNLFATTFFTLTGFHGLHVTVGLIALGIVLARALAGDFRRRPSRLLDTVGVYWHFVDVVWIVVFTVIYVRGR